MTNEKVLLDPTSESTPSERSLSERPETMDGLWGAKGSWINTCTECTPEDVLVRDHIEDMEFIPIDERPHASTSRTTAVIQP